MSWYRSYTRIWIRSLILKLNFFSVCQDFHLYTMNWYKSYKNIDSVFNFFVQFVHSNSSFLYSELVDLTIIWILSLILKQKKLFSLPRLTSFHNEIVYVLQEYRFGLWYWKYNFCSVCPKDSMESLSLQRLSSVHSELV